MKAETLIERYEVFCPQELSMEGDVTGLQLGSLDKDLSRVMVALDIREDTVKEAIAQGVDLIIVKHAPIFRPLKNLVDNPQNRLLLDLVKHDIAVYVSHTNIDVVPGGLNDWFCELLDVTDTTYLSQTQAGYGIGRVGHIAPQTLEQFANLVKAKFGLDSVRLVSYEKESQALLDCVAICGGSGQSFYPEAIKKGAQVYVTGDIYYHTAQEMLTQGLLAIDPGHHIEVLFVEKVAQLLNLWKEAQGWDVTILQSQANTNPFYHR
ncbi:Nif3-like dinuclear metal center hexameric protein [Streptococcus sp. DD12]|uniref:Nif3-like dinuclear metal center hexameric protein n=1 Tax=Streptococcus sp. DD12 TaxID=1777880 RepID=UPI000798BDF6|nr:Nif3-like dinuclear metal center hexameric protein [Streptococcus sp. DD12]KXT76295.1 hypothetical protein STRDD12_00632 [Streptococcus sp. DD12]